MKTSKFYNSNYTFLGKTVDNCHRNVDMFSDGDTIYAVYDLCEHTEYSAEESISKIKKNINEYLFTPYIEFID